MAENTPQDTSHGHATPEKQKDANPFPIVGVGASAGGLETLERFLDNLAPDSGVAFVVVTHMDPTHKSLLGELLSKRTVLPVHEATDGMVVEPNGLYLIQPNTDIVLRDGVLRLLPPARSQGVRRPIDTFFRSLATERGRLAICVVLSGAGSDGSLGLKEVKGVGGMVMVQDPKTASYDGMPRSAVATGMADFILPVEKMPSKLLDYIQKAKQVDAYTGAQAASLEREVENIISLLHHRLGYDFSHYKTNTIKRRIEKRIMVTTAESLESYYRELEENDEELDSLLDDLLIGVTSFFRDPKAYAVLERTVIPALFKDKNRKDPIRIWVPGCSTGEEPYSLAILMQEHMERIKRIHDVKIFATDLDANAIDFARTGSYPANIAADVSEDRLNRFFRLKDNRYSLVKHLRKMIVFAAHDLLGDPPFFKLDMVSCRNLLIYMNADVHQRVFPMFHASLNPGGFLWLGPSESIGSFTDQFSMVDKKWRVYKRSLLSTSAKGTFPLAARRLETDKRFQPTHANAAVTNPAGLLQQGLLERFGHPAVLINDSLDVLYYFGDTSEVLRQPGGEPSSNLAKIARRGLRVRLRAAIQQAIKTKKPVTAPKVAVQGGGAYRVHIDPVEATSIDELLFAVSFEKLDDSVSYSAVDAAGDRRDDERFEELENELHITEKQLQETIEQLETANDKFRSSNEELMSMNEELQSSNEELETSQEELQALNEELITVNAELSSKVDDLQEANSDIENFLASSNVATLFVDSKLIIRRFTPRAMDLFHLINSDIGRPLGHVVSILEYDSLVEDCRAVLENTSELEKEIPAKGGVHYLMRLFPYRTTDDIVAGVVLTFVDITRRHQIEEELEQRVAERTRELHERQALLQAVMQAYPGGSINVFDRELRYIFAQGQGFEDIDVNPDELIGKTHAELYPAEQVEKVKPFYDRAFAGEDVEFDLFLDGRHYAMAASPLEDTENDENIDHIIVVARDDTERKKAELKLKRTTRRLAEAQRIAAMGDWDWDPEEDVVTWSQELYHVMGLDTALPPPEYKGQLALYHPEDAEKLDTAVKGTLAQGGSFEVELRRTHPDTGERYLLSRGTCETDDAGAVVKMYGTVMDITNLKEAERKRKEAHQHLLNVLESTTDAFFEMDPDFTVTFINSKAVDALNLSSKKDVLGRNLWEAFPNAVGSTFYTEYHRALREKATVEFEEYFPPMDRWFEVHGYGSQTGLSVYFRVITDRKKAEEALRNSEQRFRAIFEESGDAILLADDSGKYIDANPAAVEMLGYSLKELRAMTAQDITPADKHDTYATLWEAFQDHGVQSGEYTLLRKDGETIEVEYRATCNIQPGRHLSVMRDISEQKRHQKALNAALEQTKAANQAKSAFLANMSHEIRTPLNGIMGMLELLKVTGLSEEQITYADHAITSSKRLTALLSDILDLSRVEAGKMSLYEENFELAQTLADIKHLFSHGMEEKGLQFSVHVDSSIPSVLYGDPTRLFQVLSNLVGNAIKFTDHGVVDLRAEYLDGAADASCRLLFTVSDTGAGMAPEVLDVLFEPFSQGEDNAKRPNVGAGLGLSIVKHIVHMMRGSACIDSEPGKGTTIYIALGFDIPKRPENIAQEETVEPLAGRRCRILLAEDEAVNRLSSLHLLSQAGCEVEAVENGRQAVEKLRTSDFDVILMDVQMPEMNGVEATQAIRKGEAGADKTDIPIVALTAYAMDGDRERFLKAGMTHYLSKPMDVSSLTLLINEVLRDAGK